MSVCMHVCASVRICVCMCVVFVYYRLVLSHQPLLSYIRLTVNFVYCTTVNNLLDICFILH